MTQLAIKGHSTRGKEVINLLEMLGANRLGYKDTFVGFYYYIECGAICSSDEYPTYSTIFTLEEFEEKYPYKVGDKVFFGDINYIGWEIESMQWMSNEIKYIIKDNSKSRLCDFKAEHLKPYKEKTMDKKHKGKCTIGYIQELGNRDMELIIPYNQEIVIDNGRYILRDKKPQYPKTFSECCKILENNMINNDVFGDKRDLIKALQALIICRDAYWKIADWMPNWNDDLGLHYTIIFNGAYTNKINETNSYSLLAFPTQEMRDAFYENFKGLIEECKELL